MEAAAAMLSPSMTGLIVLAAALVAATALGLALRWRAGRFQGARSRGPVQAAQAAGTGPDVLTEADLGSQLGPQATLVQFSTAFCAPCRPTRQILAQVAETADGVNHVEIDAAARMDLVRRLHINSTPTVLVLGPDGAIVRRASGLPRKADVVAALGAVIEPDPEAVSGGAPRAAAGGGE
jgi:thiol-disulfide isomerase/thioredoxin